MSAEHATVNPAAAATPAAAVPLPPEAPEESAGPPKPRREHRYDIDLMRAICASAVIVGHVGGEFVAATGGDPRNGAAAYWLGLFLDSVTAWAVPTYFAIAGWAVLVGAPPRNGKTLRTRSLRMIVPVGIWSAVYLLWARWRETNEDPTSELALQAVFGSVRPAYHLWYFYAHVPLILLLGFVVLLRAGKRPWGVAVALLVVAAAPTAFGDLAQLTGWDVPKFGWQAGTYSLVYAVLGTLLLTLPPTGRRVWWMAGAVLSLAAVIWSQDQVHFVIPNANVLVAALTCCVLLSLNGLRIPERLRAPLTRLTGAGLGAFMCHVLLLKTFAPRLASAEHGWLGTTALVAAYIAAVVVPAFAASMLWGRLGLRRYLG
ncbi:acyltransferase [Streptomyces sp. N2-109]|uniref:Acyltransferase n=1 Tax=Streptomyces gossypii TaxID=2883101 RepID=A0ABT2JXT1_9ACTN|nr:acyltransferase [Streptomyces gossypii]MCT2592710.1 acyltransferase [Streptomyces gossypii]